MPLTRNDYSPTRVATHDLRDWNKHFIEWYDSRRKMTRVRMLQGDNANIEDCLDMIEHLLAIHQAHHEVSKEDNWWIRFPNMIVEPREDDKIYNVTTEEVYTVKYLGRDPKYQVWDSRVYLSGVTAPLVSDQLQIIDKNRLVRFRLGNPMEPAKTVTSTEGELGHSESEPWRPTVTARIRKKEPASIGKHPFGESKVLKPQLFEIFRDPLNRKFHSIEIWRQPYEQLVQFDCWDTNNLGALRLAEWFTQFMREHIGTLRRHGVGEILFWTQRDKEASEQWREGILGYNVQYVIKTESLSVVRRANLRSLSLHLRVVKHSQGFSGGIPSGEAMYFGRVHDTSGDYLYGTFDIEDHGWDDPVELASNTDDPFDGVTGQFETRP